MHAAQRIQQRGISKEAVEWAVGVGSVIQKQGLDMVFVRDKDLGAIPKSLADEIRGLTLLLDQGVVITAYKGGRGSFHRLRKKDKVNRKAHRAA